MERAVKEKDWPLLRPAARKTIQICPYLNFIPNRVVTHGIFPGLNAVLLHQTPLEKDSFLFFSGPNAKSWGLKCQHEMFLLIWSVSPHHVVPPGRGISSEKRKPLPHYAANFRHQEKMFGKFWPGFQALRSGTLCSLLPWG